MSSSASASVSGSDNIEVLGDMSASADIKITEDISMPDGLDTFESEEEQLVKVQPKSDSESEKKSSSLGLILGLTIGTVVIGLVVYFLVIKKKKVVQKTV